MEFFFPLTKMRWLLFLGGWGLFCIGGLGWAQDLDPRLPQYRHPVLKLFPLAMVDFFQYTLHAGFEIPTAQYNSFQVEGGWVFGHLGEDLGTGTTETDYQQRGFKVRLQWREYFPSGRPPERILYTLTGGYLALQAGYQYYYQQLGYIDTFSIYPPPSQPTGGVFYDRVVQAFSASFLLGYQAQVGSRIIFDAYAGLGVRYAMHDWKPMTPPYSYRFTPVGDFILRRGGRPIPHIGFSFGWILR